MRSALNPLRKVATGERKTPPLFRAARTANHHASKRRTQISLAHGFTTMGQRRAAPLQRGSVVTSLDTSGASSKTPEQIAAPTHQMPTSNADIRCRHRMPPTSADVKCHQRQANIKCRQRMRRRRMRRHQRRAAPERHLEGGAVGPYGIRVRSTRDGVVHLSGSVQTIRDWRAAEREARDRSGVTDVQNDLSILVR